MIQAKNDSDFAMNVRNNTSRYVTLFHEAAEELKPMQTVTLQQRDVFDILEVGSYIYRVWSNDLFSFSRPFSLLLV